MRKKSLIVIIVYLVIAVSLILLVFLNFGPLVGAAMNILLLVLVGVANLLYKPIQKQVEAFVYNLFEDNSVHRICIFGHAGSGKSTFIDTAFTFEDPNKARTSNENFDYYDFQINLTTKKTVSVKIADYKGQDPGMIIIDAPESFFGAKGHRLINTLLLIVDLAPRKTDDRGNELSDHDLHEWLKADTLKKIQERIVNHNKYINEVTFQLLSNAIYSNNLKNIILIINKLDLIEKLVDDGYLSLGTKTVKDYAVEQFNTTITDITRACNELGKINFACLAISVKNANDVKPLIIDIFK